MLTIPRMVAAANELRAENQNVTIRALARKLGETPGTIDYAVWVYRFDEKIGMFADTKFPGLVYAQAVDALRQRGIEHVTCRILAKELGLRRGSVSMALSRHPEYARILRIVTEGERRRRLRRVAYETMIKNGLSSKRGIADAMGVSRFQVYRDCDRDPTLKQKFKHAEVTG